MYGIFYLFRMLSVFLFLFSNIVLLFLVLSVFGKINNGKMLKYMMMVAFGAMSYGTLTSFAKIAYTEGYTPGEITFTQAFLGALILWLLAFLRSIKEKKSKIAFNWRLILAGTAMGLSAYCFYLSVKYIPVTLAIVLLMQVSWISNIAEWLIFKKKYSKTDVLATSLILLGTVLAGNLLNVQNLNFSLSGILLATSSAIFYTIYVISTSKLGNGIPMLEKSALMTTGSALLILIINLPSFAISSHIDFGLLKWGSFLAVFGTVIPPICFTTGMPRIGPGLSAILLTLELPAVVLCAYIILGEQVSFIQVIGILIMIGAIVYPNLVKARGEKQIEVKTVNKISQSP